MAREIWESPDKSVLLINVHKRNTECDRGCLMHNPQHPNNVANVENWPYHWRSDRGIMERSCPHGVGHPDPDSADYYERNGQGYEYVHGCHMVDGVPCCQRVIE